MIRVHGTFHPAADVVLYNGDCREFLRTVPNGLARLVVTSPPYNLGKSYEKRTHLERYLAEQAEVIRECARILADDGSLCWQVGNFVENGVLLQQEKPVA